jgi:glycosyltransferase involved in cell wall biosynthesis
LPGKNRCRHRRMPQLFLKQRQPVFLQKYRPDLNLPLISVTVCTYNGAPYLEEQLNSLLAQTYPHLEIVVVDDGSTDATWSILERFATQHSHIRLYRNRQNLGYIANFEKCMGLATGTLIAPCDQDDVWLPGKLQQLYDNINGYPMIYSDSELVHADLAPTGKRLSDKKNLASYHNCLVFATDNCIAGHATLLKKAFLEQALPFPRDIPHDYWLAFCATLQGGVKYLDEPLVKYRHHAGNVIGAIRTVRKKISPQEKKARKIQQDDLTRKRIQAFYAKCPDSLVQEKEVLRLLTESYQDFSLRHNLQRVRLFLRHRDLLLAIKKRSGFRKFIFCFKMFSRIK